MVDEIDDTYFSGAGDEPLERLGRPKDDLPSVIDFVEWYPEQVKKKQLHNLPRWRIENIDDLKIRTCIIIEKISRYNYTNKYVLMVIFLRILRITVHRFPVKGLTKFTNNLLALR